MRIKIENWEIKTYESDKKSRRKKIKQKGKREILKTKQKQIETIMQNQKKEYNEKNKQNKSEKKTKK